MPRAYDQCVRPVTLYPSAVQLHRAAFPSLIAQAIAPSVGAWLVDTSGADATIGVLTLFACINVVLIAMLWFACRSHIARV